MTQRRLTITEKRARAMCADIAEFGGTTLTVEWIRSKTWGHNPRIVWRGEKVTSVSGCGYDKLSACLASALCWLADTDEAHSAIARTQGCGEETTAKALRAIGWNLRAVARGDTFDAYRLERVAAKDSRVTE